MPLSEERRRERGFNQSELIAGIFARHVGVPFETRTLVRTKHARPQSEIRGRDLRLENVRGAFLVPDEEAVRGGSFILVDDVTTSGATFLEAARALKRAGARTVIALAVAEA